MERQDFPRLKEMIISLSEMYGRKPPSEFIFSIWWKALKAYDINTVSQALSAHIVNPDNGQFMPKPADVVRLVGGTSNDKALRAWTLVSDAVRLVGPWESVAFDDRLIHRVINDMGGWTNLCMKNDGDWDFVRNEFLNRYRGFVYRNEMPPYPPVLVGESEAFNRRNGFEIKSPRLIGDLEKAEAVIAGGSRDIARIQSIKEVLKLSA